MAHLSHLNYALSVFSFFATEALLGKHARYKRGGRKPKIENGEGGREKLDSMNDFTSLPPFLRTCKSLGNGVQKFK